MTLVSKRAGDWLRIGSTAVSGALTPIAFWANGNADVDNSPQMVFQSYPSGFTVNGLNPGLLGLGTAAPATPLHVLINTASAGATDWRDGDAITTECFPTASPPLTNLCRAIYARANSTATSLGLGYGVHAVGSGAQSYALVADAINGARFAGVFTGDVLVSGCIQASGGATLGTCSSDARLKKNIQHFSPVLDKLVRLQPVSYNWRAEEFPQFHFGTSRTTGLIAQEVEKVFPEMVSVDKDGFKRVNYSELPYLMLQAIRELKAANDSLRDQLKAEEEQTRRLAARNQDRDGERSELAQLRGEVERLAAMVRTNQGATVQASVAAAHR